MDRRKRGHGLKEVSFIPKPPFNLSKTRSLRLKAGLNYEKKVVRALRRLFPDSEILPSLWLQYIDDEGIGYAQPDIIMLGEHPPIIVECKYTYTKSGFNQLDFYARLLNHLWGRPTKLLQVAKRLTRNPKGAILGTCLDILTSPHRHNIFHLR